MLNIRINKRSVYCMSYKTGFCYLVSIVSLCVSVVFWIKGASVSSMSSGTSFLTRDVPAIVSAGNYYIAVSAVIFAFCAFVGASVLQYCDTSLALKEQANDILRNGMRSINTAKKTCTKCGKSIAADAITCPMCGQ